MVQADKCHFPYKNEIPFSVLYSKLVLHVQIIWGESWGLVHISVKLLIRSI